MPKAADVFYGIESGPSAASERSAGRVTGGAPMSHCTWISCERDKVHGGVGVEQQIRRGMAIGNSGGQRGS